MSATGNWRPLRSYTCWPKGVPKTLSYPEIPLFKILRSSALQWPDRNAIIFAGIEVTYRELDELSDRFAGSLVEMGIKKGDRVAIHLPNCPQFAIAYYGLLKAGAVFTPVSPLLTDREIELQLNDSGARILITLDLLFDIPRRILDRTKVEETVVTSLADCYPPLSVSAKMLSKKAILEAIDFVSLLEGQRKPPQIEIDPKEDLAHLSYTGGTTGMPKGVMLTHFNAVSSCCQMASWFGGGDFRYEDEKVLIRRSDGDSEELHPTRRGEEVSLVVVPWFHSMGVFSNLNVQVIGGSTMVVLPRFEPEEFLRAINKYRVTVFGGVPQLISRLIETPLFNAIDMSGIKLIGSGAAPISPLLLEAMYKKIGGIVCEAYGLTECAGGCTANPPSRKGSKLGSVGLPLPDTKIKIVDIEGGDWELTPGEVGEICVKGPQVMKGYWERPQETEQVLREGWIYTGDIGYLDKDGYLHIVDRKKDMVIYKGYNVYPRELEEVLGKHSAVQQVAVVGEPDERAGEIPVAFVVLRQGSNVTEQQLLEYANSKLAGYKKIRKLFVVETLPISPAGKILKRILRAQLKQLSRG